MPGSTEGARAELAERLRARREEIEQTVRARVYAIADPDETADPAYAEDLRAAVSAALDYGLAAIERGEARVPPAPPALLAQARLAARNGVSLDTVLRRYFAGYTLLGDFLMEEAERGSLLRDSALNDLLRGQAELFDRLVAVVSDEHTSEIQSRLRSPEQRQAEQVKRALAGELLDLADLGYEIDAWHLALIATDAGISTAIRELAAALDRRVLLVQPDRGTVWAWLGGRRRIDAEEITRRASAHLPDGARLAVGEPGRSIAGWRLSHRQARAAFSVAHRRPPGIVRYVEVGLLASVIRDDLLVNSLHRIYLDPLTEGHADGTTLCVTLGAYFAACRNVSSAAAALGVSRQTVNSRLRTVEERIGRPLDAFAAEMEIALELWDLGSSQRPPAA